MFSVNLFFTSIYRLTLEIQYSKTEGISWLGSGGILHNNLSLVNCEKKTIRCREKGRFAPEIQAF
jgi:hypothetical protein